MQCVSTESLCHSGTATCPLRQKKSPIQVDKLTETTSVTSDVRAVDMMCPSPEVREKSKRCALKINGEKPSSSLFLLLLCLFNWLGLFSASGFMESASQGFQSHL